MSNNATDPIVIVGGARTPMGGFQGDLSPLTAPELGAAAIKAAVERAGIQPADVDGLYLKCWCWSRPCQTSHA